MKQNYISVYHCCIYFLQIFNLGTFIDYSIHIFYKYSENEIRYTNYKKHNHYSPANCTSLHSFQLQNYIFFLTLLIPMNSFKTGKSYFTEKSLFSKKMFVSIEIQDFISLTKVPKLESCSHTLHLKGEAGFSLEGPMQST